jgi:hypothetical protein
MHNALTHMQPYEVASSGRKFMFITVIAAAVLVSTNPVAAGATPVPSIVKAAETAPNPRVCLVRNITGSMLPLRTCKTLAEWRARGIDPLPQR